ncbi:MAG: inorganic diphosphatase [Candidatus Azosocius agrarius]|nr:MAG: inorganic diphosphatase [Gammaproteobacteria bacterium]
MIKDLFFGERFPDIVNVVIEISSNSKPVKYEMNKKTGMLHVDRFISTSMRYPCNYGYIPKTLSDDGDPLDVLVLSPNSLISGCVIEVRPIGLLNMIDESGLDCKILSVPIDKLTSLYSSIRNYTDLDFSLLNKIEHFFKHYKDLEKNKWVNVGSWEDAIKAKNEIVKCVNNFV